MSCFFFFYFSNLIIWCYLSLFKYASPLFFLSSWIPYFMFLMTDLNSPQKGQRERDRERERGGERVIGREMLLPSVPVTGLGLCSCHTAFHNIEFFWEGPVVCAFFSCAPCECLSLSLPLFCTVTKNREVTMLSKAWCSSIDCPRLSTTLSHQRLSPISCCLMPSFPSSLTS